jgi:hypothetical protein
VKSTPFNLQKDLAPIPLKESVYKKATQLKQAGLDWEPQVGCFVWDPEGHIGVPSPFPHKIYFILNLNHFLKIFGDTQTMKEKLVWVPTWHQAILICQKMNVSHQQLNNLIQLRDILEPEASLLKLYHILFSVMTAN